jgi:hypothetical protein
VNRHLFFFKERNSEYPDNARDTGAAQHNDAIAFSDVSLIFACSQNMIHGSNSAVPRSDTLKAIHPNLLLRCFRQVHARFSEEIDVCLEMF